ncbi:UrcA family protein [Sphingopyxis sp. MWB1]|uniref:UrcA family protein n=1 Tax=Sphingopyxis sp. MWB1 TaxID=1537715 RepID=UPI00051A05F6|nr:UrcA family protein [Sphingopyxis sp. MWB1]
MLKLKTIIATSLLAVTTTVSVAGAQETDRRTVEVAVADLDLSTAAGQAVLDRRIELALRQVCATDPRPDLRQQAQAQSCRAQAMREIEPQLASLTGGGNTMLAKREQNYVAAR